MDAKQFLRHIQKLDAQTQQKQEQVKNLRRSLTSIQGLRYDRDKVQTSPTDALADKIAALIDAEHDLAEEIADLEIERTNAVRMIDKLDNADYITILYDHYIQYMCFEDIADDIDKSYSRTIHMHAEALNCLSQLLEEENKKYLSIA